jgi:hypothetical protein
MLLKINLLRKFPQNCISDLNTFKTNLQWLETIVVYVLEYNAPNVCRISASLFYLTLSDVKD